MEDLPEEEMAEPVLLPDRDILLQEKVNLPFTDDPLPGETELQVTYAGFGMRLFAHILDLILLYYPVGYLSAFLVPDGLDMKSSMGLAALIAVIAHTLYYAGMESSSVQGTIGKRVTGLAVVDTSGRTLTFSSAAVRYLLMFLSVLPLGFGIWAMFSDRRKQCWHDSIAGALVVDASSLPEEEAAQPGPQP